jgi:outer membrane protein assembly factor BamD
MTKKSLALAIVLILVFAASASAYWIWTPGTKKFINPKYAVKDSPKEQYDWAMTFYNAKNYQRAVAEFEKLVKNYEYSEYASKAQYYVGLSYEQMSKFYFAFQAYQKTIDNFPHIDNMDEIIAREFNIANLYFAKGSPKLLGADIMTSTDRAVEIYKKVVDNSPYGKLADKALFNMGLALKKVERYDEAVEAFQRIVDDYKDSEYYDKAQYEVAYCAYKSSLKPAYASEPTEKAIRAFEDFARENRDDKLTEEADKTLQRLKDKMAEKSLITARFYEKIKKYESAIVYYKDIIERCPESSYVNEARNKIEELEKKRSKK